ncbi:MAG: NAD(+) diphosphatase [Gemmatimonadota bacterium]|nr:NAD(+) diphosphatase [Gemmatimonadota bacterium]
MSDVEIVSGGETRGHGPNHFAGGAIDRATVRRADPDWVADSRSHPEARVVPVWRSRSLLSSLEDDGQGYDPVFLSPRAARGYVEGEKEWLFLGLDADKPIFAARVIGDGEAPPDPFPTLGEFLDLHRVGALLRQSEGALLAYARAVTTWSIRHRFCGRCGHETHPTDGGHVRRCSNELCETQHFPRTDPAIIVLVEDGDRCLLGRKDIWPEGVYSTLAGFVEPGESLSEAVVREVREESGIDVGEVRYRSSQPWPFPSSLMLGFHAVRMGGELRPDGDELEDARWFHRDDFARRREIGLRLPSRVSIARRLIQEWLDGV